MHLDQPKMNYSKDIQLDLFPFGDSHFVQCSHYSPKFLPLKINYTLTLNIVPKRSIIQFTAMNLQRTTNFKNIRRASDQTETNLNKKIFFFFKSRIRFNHISGSHEIVPSAALSHEAIATIVP